MSYIPRQETAHFEPLAGLGGEWREFADEEYAAMNDTVGGGLDRWYEHVDDEPKKKKAAKAAGGES